jgi:soluble lytic murein transglycosylase-like protein
MTEMFAETNQEIERQAALGNLDPNILKSIVTQESNYNPYAIRYEPSYAYLYAVPHYAQFLNISQDTEITTQKISWGLGQLMGAVAREQGHVGPMGQLFEVETNIKIMIVLIKKMQSRGYEELGEIFSCYNGGVGAVLKMKDGIYPNQGYVDSCMSHYKKLKQGGINAIR